MFFFCGDAVDDDDDDDDDEDAKNDKEDDDDDDDDDCNMKNTGVSGGTVRGAACCMRGMLGARPEPEKDEEEVPEAWSGSSEGRWLVRFLSRVMVGEVLLWTRFSGCLAVSARNVIKEEYAGWPLSPPP